MKKNLVHFVRVAVEVGANARQEYEAGGMSLGEHNWVIEKSISVLSNDLEALLKENLGIA